MDFQLTQAEIQRFNARRPRSAHNSVCHAPSQVLYFGMRGEVMLCCANRSHLAGRYPAQSIMECWTSETIQQVRSALKTGDMSLGCKGCYELIRGGNFANLPGGTYDHIAPNPNGWPTRMDFELTNTCNLECVTCRGELSSSIRRNRDKLPPIESPYDDAFIQQLKVFIPHLKQSYFAGGEPFLINQYLEIWDLMADLNPHHHLSVQTNGTVLSDRIKKLLERLKMSIAVSIDSVNEARFEAIRVNAKWDQVYQHILYFKEYCTRKGTQLTISYTPMAKNWMELPEAIAFCNRLGIKIFFNNLSFPKHLAFSSFSAEKLVEIVDFLQDWKASRKSQVEIANAITYDDLVQQITYWRDEAVRIEQRPAAGVILRNEDYFGALKSFIGNHYPGEKAEVLYTEISGKLQAVFDIAVSNGHEAGLWEHMATVEFAMLCTYIPGKTEQELLAAFRTALMPG